MVGTTDRVMPQMHMRDMVESNNSLENENYRRQEAMTEARQIYQAECQSILQQLPDYVKDKFGDIGYGSFQGKWYPVLLISPFDIATGPARSAWLQSFDEVSPHVNEYDRSYDIQRAFCILCFIFLFTVLFSTRFISFAVVKTK
jgi:hypothetical protein